MRQTLLFRCPECFGELSDASPDHSTYVVNGEAVCNFVCYLNRIGARSTRMSAEFEDVPGTINTV